MKCEKRPAVPRAPAADLAQGNRRIAGRTVVRMDSNDDMTSRILASLAALPLHEQADAISALIGSVIKEMPEDRILEIRHEIASELDARIPVVQATLDLIDGQLALREIAGKSTWR
jgi:hypothetical protein